MPREGPKGIVKLPNGEEFTITQEGTIEAKIGIIFRICDNGTLEFKGSMSSVGVQFHRIVLHY